MGTTPNLAAMKENHSEVLEHSKKYAAEFQKREWNKFNIGDKVLMKNELKLNKMDDEYKEEGIVIEIRNHDSYMIETNKGNKLIRHASHLRLKPGDVGS